MLEVQPRILVVSKADGNSAGAMGDRLRERIAAYAPEHAFAFSCLHVSSAQEMWRKLRDRSTRLEQSYGSLVIVHVGEYPDARSASDKLVGLLRATPDPQAASWIDEDHTRRATSLVAAFPCFWIVFYATVRESSAESDALEPVVGRLKQLDLFDREFCGAEPAFKRRQDETCQRWAKLHFAVESVDDKNTERPPLWLRLYLDGHRMSFDADGFRTAMRFTLIDWSLNSELTNRPPKNETPRRRTERLAVADALLSRLSSVCVAVDEEAEYAQLAAYSAYRFGMRSWVVDSRSMFQGDQAGPDESWLSQEDPWDCCLLIRDLELAFDGTAREFSRATRDIRNWRWHPYERGRVTVCAPNALAADGIEEEWKQVWPPPTPSGGRVIARVVSSASGVVRADSLGGLLQRPRPTAAEWVEADKTGQLSPRNGSSDPSAWAPPHAYFGLQKPVGSVYLIEEMRSALPSSPRLGNRTVLERIASFRLDNEHDVHSSHSTAASLLVIASELLRQSHEWHAFASSREHLSPAIIAALHASDASELLFGRAITRRARANSILLRSETLAEAQFYGMRSDLQTTLKRRRAEIERLTRILPSLAFRRAVRARVWGRLRSVLSDHDQVEASDFANKEVLINQRLTGVNMPVVLRASCGRRFVSSWNVLAAFRLWCKRRLFEQLASAPFLIALHVVAIISFSAVLYQMQPDQYEYKLHDVVVKLLLTSVQFQIEDGVCPGIDGTDDPASLGVALVLWLFLVWNYIFVGAFLTGLLVRILSRR
jgi:hypothetical protein